jgi:hypothetical protein
VLTDSRGVQVAKPEVQRNWTKILRARIASLATCGQSAGSVQISENYQRMKKTLFGTVQL